ncbi:hypothetical protein [Nocardiopsis sp. MG754419]|uniref:hypothetical protein n=1 Tax=Nocardiopsis sp. MG754419 TaxID=2259865 RepID=UPI0024B0DF0A|nr:hypothetical protein [Nocardiopsis sp. MG754419]
MNAGPGSGGGSLGGGGGSPGSGLSDALGRDLDVGAPRENSYSIGDGWGSPGAEDQLLTPMTPHVEPDHNGLLAGGGSLSSDPGSGGDDAFNGAVGGNGGGNGGANFGGVGGGMGGMGGMGGGMPPMMPPMMPPGGAGGGQNESRTRSTWLSEDERVWGTSEGDRFSVLGRPAPGDNTKGSPHEYVPGADGAGSRTSTGGPGEGHPGKRKPGIGNRRGRLQGQGDQRED